MGFPRRSAARPAIRRALTFVAAVAMALPAASLPVPAAASVPDIGVVSTSQWTDGTAVHIVGQLQNNTANNVTLVRVTVSLTDAIANDSAWTWATVNVIGPNELSPFELVLAPAPAGYHFLAPPNSRRSGRTC